MAVERLARTTHRPLDHAHERAALTLVFAAGVGALAYGLLQLASTRIGADPIGALQAMADQLPTTLPVATSVTLAAAANIIGGAILLRLISGQPYRSLAQAILCGLVGAVLLDVMAMGVLGSLGLFAWPVLGALLLMPLLLASRAAPLIVSRTQDARVPQTPPIGWYLVALLWVPPLIFALASPVAPGPDVAPNHVAPVEHLRTFGALATLDLAPDAHYGPSRILLGFQALFGVASTVSGVPAVTAVAQLAVPLIGLVALAAWSLARELGGPRAGTWALLLLPLSVTYQRLNDPRAGVLVFALVATALWLAIEPLGSNRRRRVLVLGCAVGATILVHPLLGMYGAAFLAVGAVLRPRLHAGHVWPALAVGALLAAPQFAAAAAIALPAWTVVIPVPLAVATGLLGVGLSQRLPALERLVVPVVMVTLVVVGMLVVLLLAPEDFGAAWQRVWRDNGYPIIVAAASFALLIWRKRGLELIAAAALVAICVALITVALPRNTIVMRMIYLESAKYVFIVPTLLTVAGAAGLAAFWSWARPPLAARVLVSGLVVVVAATPLDGSFISEVNQGEHRWAEAVSVTLRNTQRGGLYGFPDARWMVNPDQQALLARLSGEAACGAISHSTAVLQVAADIQPWIATPLAAFTGVVVTAATPRPERSTHTVGARLHDVEDLPALLGPAYPYVVLEPAGLEPLVREQIVAAGYESIFANTRGEIFAAPGVSCRLPA